MGLMPGKFDQGGMDHLGWAVISDLKTDFVFDVFIGALMKFMSTAGTMDRHLELYRA